MNFSFSRRTDLALAALNALAESPDHKRSRPHLAAELGTTASFLPQVMAPLTRAGWVISQRGPGGGYRLSDTASSARVLDVVEVMEGPTDNGRCVLRSGPCPESRCHVHSVWVEARRVLVEGFEDVSVMQAHIKEER